MTLPFLLLIIGGALRLKHYCANRSLWLDESMLALNIMERSFTGLFQRLDYNQGAPLFFLLLEKVVVSLFGPVEYALRLVPLLSSLISLVFFYLLAKRLIPQKYLLVCISMFAFSYNLIYYAQEAKQYSVDVAVALGLVYVFLRYRDSDREYNHATAILALCGAVSIWLSHPAIFVLSAIGVSLILSASRKKHQTSIFQVAVPLTSWVVSFAVNYFWISTKLVSNDDLFTYWQFGFIPLPMSFNALKEFSQIFQSFLDYSGFPLPLTILVVVLILIASVEMLSKGCYEEFSIVSVFCFTLVASVLHKYPFSYRMVLFLTPFLYLCIARGLSVITQGQKPVIVQMLNGVFVILFAYHGYHLMTTPIMKEEVRPLIAYLKENQKKGDNLYVYYGAIPAMKYYQKLLELDDGNWHYGISPRDDPSAFERDIQKVAQMNRVWFLFSHTWRQEEDLFLSKICGVRVDEYHAIGASIYLYSFTGVGSYSKLQRTPQPLH